MAATNPFDWRGNRTIDEMIGASWELKTNTGGAILSTSAGSGIAFSGTLQMVGDLLTMDVPSGGLMVMQSRWAGCTPGLAYMFKVKVAAEPGCLAVASLGCGWYDKDANLIYEQYGVSSLTITPTKELVLLRGGMFSPPNAYYGRILLKAEAVAGAGVIYFGPPDVGPANLDFEVGPAVSPF